MKKTIHLLISLILIVSVLLSGCVSSSSKTYEYELINKENTSFKTTDTILAQNGKTDYKIVVPDKITNLVNVSAQELQLFFEKSTGAKLSIVSDKKLTYNNSEKYISIGRTTLLESQTDIDIKYEELGEAGACIVTKQNTVYICGASDHGTLNSTYKFMEMQFGFKAYANDEIHLDYYDKLQLLDFNYKYDPVIDWNYGYSQDGALPEYYGYDPELMLENARMFGYVGRDGGRGLDGNLFSTWCHVIPSILPPALYPQYYNNGQLCYTNEEALNIFCERLMESYGRRSEPWIHMGGADNVGACQCDNCAAANAKYTRSGVYIRFLNSVADYVEKYYEEKGIDRTLKIYSLSYYMTEIPPVLTDNEGNFITGADGKCIPTDPSVLPDDEGKVTVGIMFAPIRACWTHALGDETCEMNKETTKNLKGWTDLTSDILVYNYGDHWLMPAGFHDTWSYYVGSYAFYEEVGGIVYVVDTAADLEIDPLSNFRTFFRNQFAWNPNRDFRSLLTEFCENYYGPAAGMIEEYFYDYMEQHNSIYTQQNAPCRVFSIDFTGSKYWPRAFWLGMENTLKNGMYLIEQSKYSEEQKEIYRERVFREYFLTVYHEYKYYSGSLTANEKSEKIAVLRQGFDMYNLTNDVGV